jgi:hypothetical protein
LGQGFGHSSWTSRHVSHLNFASSGIFAMRQFEKAFSELFWACFSSISGMF